MNLKLQVIIAAIILVALVVIVNMIRRHKLELKYALSWMFLGTGILIMDCLPGLTEALSNLLGIQLPINMLFFLGFCFSLMVIFSLTVAVSRLSNKIKKLVQEVALLEKQLESRNNAAVTGYTDVKAADITEEAL